jgi:uncharacterized damage-inducible protein DinB
MALLKPEYLDRSAYYTLYTDLATDQDLFTSFETSTKATLDMIESLSENDLNKRYAEGKWSIAQVLVHNMDSERILSFRALAIARGEKNKIQGYEENDYAEQDFSNTRTLADIKEEFLAVRASTIQLFKNLHEKALHQEGNSNGLIVTPCVLGWMISGHTLHHLNILKERYL